MVDRFRYELRHLQRPDMIVEALPFVTRSSTVDGELHEVVAYRLDVSTVDAAINAEIARARSLGKDLEWKVFSFDEPLDLRDRLSARGFVVGEREALLAYDLRQGLAPFSAPDGCQVRRVTSLGELAQFREVAERVFNKDYSLTTGQLAEAIQSGQPGHDAFVAYAEGQPVSIGRLYTDPQSHFAGMYGGGTLPEFRGRGYYRSVVEARAHFAAACGARYLQVDALPTSHPILERLGFVFLADTWPCIWKSGR